MNNKKIIHLIQSLDNGGCENMLLRTLPFLNKFKHEIITISHSGELFEKFKEKNISVYNIGQKNPLDLPSYFRILKKIRKENPDIVLTYLFHADAIGRLFLQIFTKTKIIPFLRTNYNHPDYRFARIFEKTTKIFAKNYLANSQSVKNFYAENIGVPREEITVIPNGIDTEFYDRIKVNKKVIEILGVKKNEFFIICVANLHINKGHKYLLEAFENIYKKDCNIKLLLVGDGKEKKNLLRQIENYYSKKNILFLGKRNDVPELLKGSDIFVLPTFFEGMSNAIIEAMAVGLPIITTDIPENKELIMNKVTGILIPKENIEALSEAINSLKNNPALAKKLSDNAKEYAKKKFDMRKISDEWENFLENII